MALQLPNRLRPRFARDVSREHWALKTGNPQQFIDISQLALSCARASDGGDGTVTAQAIRRTAAILVNENASLLIDDLGRALARWPPTAARYSHDDFERLMANLTPKRRPNSHSHARAMALQVSTSLAAIGSDVRQDRWQRIFPVELDGSRSREVVVTTANLLEARSRPRSAMGSEFPEPVEERT